MFNSFPTDKFTEAVTGKEREVYHKHIVFYDKSKFKCWLWINIGFVLCPSLTSFSIHESAHVSAENTKSILKRILTTYNIYDFQADE